MEEKTSAQKPLAYYPLKTDQVFEQCICAFDFETAGLGGEPLAVSWCILYENGDIFESAVDAEPGFIERFIRLMAIIGSGHIWYAHNAQYDWRYLMPYIVAHREDLRPDFGMRTETVIYRIRLTIPDDPENYIGPDAEPIEVNIDMRDSAAIWAGSLKSLTESFCPDHAKLSGAIDFEGGEIFDPSNPHHLEYAKRDSESLALGMYNLNTAITKLYGVPMGYTAAGTALKAWRRTLDKPRFAHRPSLDFCREGYYGGLVFLTDTNPHDQCTTYDINSSYPAQMQKYGVPKGTPLRCHNFYDSSRPAMYRCRITAPDDLRVPIIPYRDSKGITVWALGRIETVVTNVELEFALAHGYTDLEILEGYIWRGWDYPFEDFVTKSQKIRKEYKGTPFEKVVKLIQNSLYGKFGTKQIRREVFIPQCSEDREGAQPIDADDVFWVRESFDPDIVCHPAWAAFITARARLSLLDTVYKVGPENVLYGDTDSLTVKATAEASLIDIGEDYGQFKREKQWQTFRAIAPKVYAGKLQDSDWAGACKGIPVKHAQNQFETLYHEKLIRAEYDTLQSFYVGLKQGFRPAYNAARISTDISNSISWDLQEDGTIQPKRR